MDFFISRSFHYQLSEAAPWMGHVPREEEKLGSQIIIMVKTNQGQIK